MSDRTDHKGKSIEPELPPAYEPQAVEDRIYRSWEESGLFDPDNLPGQRREPFVIMMPPPNATGTLHIGHAMFLTLEDLMVRYHRLRGKAALWLPGTDHAAIATNTKVEKLLDREGKTKYDLGRAGFIARVEDFIRKSQGTIHKQIRKMGSSCDWSREAYTLDEVRSRTVREMFRRMYDDGLIYRGTRIVNWCPRCESTLADDEVEYREERGTLYYLRYGPFIVATTRPETKLGDTAVAVHPDDGRYRDRIGQVFQVDFGIGPQDIRVIGDPAVDRAFGSGVVGLTPAHSAVDFEMAEKNLLPLKKVIGEDGRMTALAGKYAGLAVEEARRRFVEDLKSRELLQKTEELDHNVSVCYRCGTPVEPLTSRQWFVNVDQEIPGRGKSLKRLALEAVRDGSIRILPERFEKVYFHWMENLRDWCISRQIWFGHRIPVWYCQSCHVDEETEGRAGAAGRVMASREGIVVSAGEAPLKCPTCGRDEDIGDLVQDPDTLDTWFSSSTWTFSTLGWPEETEDLKRFHPTQVLETGYDILFFWIARMILMTTYATGQVPFETVYLHGLVRDEQGRKMSKSLENIIDPIDVSEKYGTDAVRLSLIIGNTPGNDLRLSEEKIAHFRNFTNKLWNVSRYILMTVGEVRRPSGRPEPQTLADRWILARLDEVKRDSTEDIESYSFSRAGERLRDFTWNELADWYLEVSKVEGGKERLLEYVLYELLKLWHPFMPFVTEEIHRRAFAEGEGDFLMVASWGDPAPVAPESDVGDFDMVRDIITAIRNLRATYRVDVGREIDVTVHADRQIGLVKRHAEVIRRLAKVAVLTVAEGGDRPSGAASSVVRGIRVHVPLGDIIDIEQERSRIMTEIRKTEDYLTALEKKLGNRAFIERAPSEVVEAERRKREAARDRLDKLQEQLTVLD
ncbi:hypothetical protein AMJ57_00475 [Parcubacteria bacterium SG8_24]|nr:MAG: hypothetical protein AMJ57_00475 [Parcubacteria bacterium SG8_24]